MQRLYNKSHLQGIIDFNLAGAGIKAIDLELKDNNIKRVYSVYVDDKCHGLYGLCSKTEEQKMYEIAHQLLQEWE